MYPRLQQESHLIHPRHRTKGGDRFCVSEVSFYWVKGHLRLTLIGVYFSSGTECPRSSGGWNLGQFLKCWPSTRSAFVNTCQERSSMWPDVPSASTLCSRNSSLKHVSSQPLFLRFTRCSSVFTGLEALFPSQCIVNVLLSQINVTGGRNLFNMAISINYLSLHAKWCVTVKTVSFKDSQMGCKYFLIDDNRWKIVVFACCTCSLRYRRFYFTWMSLQFYLYSFCVCSQF